MKLWEISDFIREANEIIMNLDTITEEDAQRLQEALSGLEESLDQKVSSIVAMIKNLEADREAFEAARKTLAARSATVRNRADWLKEYLLREMSRAGRWRAGSDPLHQASRVTNSRAAIRPKHPETLEGIPDHLVRIIPEERRLDAEAAWRLYQKLVAEADPDELVSIPGCEVIYGEHLRIR